MSTVPLTQSMQREIDGASYDAIIIGSGPGGAACASEILEGLPDAKVAIVEWGKVANIRTAEFGLPQVRDSLLPTSEHVETVKFANRDTSGEFCEKLCWGGVCEQCASNRAIGCCLPTSCCNGYHQYSVQQGRAMGGGTYVNARIYVGLSKKDVIDCFDETRVKDYEDFAKKYEPRIARKSGPHPLQQAVCRSMGAPFVPDDTIPDDWYGKVVVNRACEEEDRRRITSYTALIAPLAYKGKIQVYENFRVKQIIHDGSGMASGVVAEDGRELGATIVVVACGALYSPALLQRSGLGNDQVGKNLHDHPYLRYAWSSDVLADSDLTEHHFVNTQYCDEDGVTADFTMGQPGRLVAFGQYVQSVQFCDFLKTLCTRPRAILPIDWCFKCFPSVLCCKPGGVPLVMGLGWQPVVRGEVKTDRDDLLGAPQVVYDTLSDEKEVAMLHDSLNKIVAAINKEPTMRQYTQQLFGESLLDELKKGTARPLSHWHVTSTCRMDTDGEPGAVDKSFKLLGTQNVFVGDGSVPRRTSIFNTMSLCYFSGYLCGQEVVKEIKANWHLRNNNRTNRK